MLASHFNVTVVGTLVALVAGSVLLNAAGGAGSTAPSPVTGGVKPVVENHKLIRTRVEINRE
jgi:hypothetical protein